MVGWFTMLEIQYTSVDPIVVVDKSAAFNVLVKFALIFVVDSICSLKHSLDDMKSTFHNGIIQWWDDNCIVLTGCDMFHVVSCK